MRRIGRNFFALLALGLSPFGGPLGAMPPKLWKEPGSPVFIKPTFEPKNIFSITEWPQAVKRVAVLPIASVLSEIPVDYFVGHDALWLGAFQATQRAEFIPVGRADLQRWSGRASFTTSQPIPRDLLEKIQRQTGADAVAWIEVSYFQPYAPQALGIRARIVELKTTETIWACDEVVESDHPRVVASLEARQLGRASLFSQATRDSSGLLSPLKLSTCVAVLLAQTLPPRPAPNYLVKYYHWRDVTSP